MTLLFELLCLLTKTIPTFVLVPDYELLHPLSMSWHVELVTKHHRSAKRCQNKEGRDETRMKEDRHVVRRERRGRGEESRGEERRREEKRKRVK